MPKEFIEIIGDAEAYKFAGFLLAQRILERLILKGTFSRDEALSVIESAAETAEKSNSPLAMTTAEIIRRLSEHSALLPPEPPRG